MCPSAPGEVLYYNIRLGMISFSTNLAIALYLIGIVTFIFNGHVVT
jgi:hypothetical protein